MLTGRARFIRSTLVGIDLLVVAVAFVAAYLTRSLSVFDRFGELYSARSYLWALWAALPIWHFSLRQAGFYHKLRVPSYKALFVRLGRAGLMFAVVFAAILYLTKGVVVSRLFVQIFIAYSLGLFALARIAIQWSDKYLRNRPGWVRQALVVGTPEEIRRITDLLPSKDEWHGRIVGGLTWEPVTEPIPGTGVPIVGSTDEMELVLRNRVVDEVIFSQSEDHRSQLERSLVACERQGVTSRVFLSFTPSTLRAKRVLETVDQENALISFESVPGNMAALAIKRLVDISAGLVGITLFGLAYLVVGPRIKRESDGPVLFQQERVGLNGRRFHLYKFRTMVADAEAQLDMLREHNEMRGRMFKMKSDPRVTNFGQLLRRTHIDEIPQFLNVLRGEMSLVGTRPPTPDEVSGYRPHHHRRISFKPGLTGLWQVRGNEEVPDFEDVVKLDTEYIDQWSLWLDMKIIGMTVRKVYREMLGRAGGSPHSAQPAA